LLLVWLLFALGGCAQLPGPPDERDPFESYNRSMYAFNDALDRTLLRPVAEVYSEYTPSPVKTGVGNFFSNLGDVRVLLNDILQFKFAQAASDFSRLVWNSTVGLFGLLDVASSLELPKHDEDFGQTLAVWGIGDGPYLVLPFFGPSTVRDTVGLAGDLSADPLRYIIEDDTTYLGAVAMRALNKRANLLSATRVLDQAAIDPYVFVRDAYLQHRRNLIYDGNPPPDETMPFNPMDASDLELERELELLDQAQQPAGPKTDVPARP
jgi:phospholipid-binding lipoprotein MlaA